MAIEVTPPRRGVVVIGELPIDGVHVDGNLVTARKVTRTTRDPDSQIEQVVDLGFVGEPESVDTAVIVISREG